MQKEKKDKHFIKKPVYEGGIHAMRKFIKDNLQYPPIALEKKIEGTVYLKYVLNYRGEVITTKVISSLGYGCDEEAERLVHLFQFKAPKNRRFKVKFHKKIQIHFRLAEQKLAPKIDQIQYNYTTNKKEKPSSSRGNNYTITVNINN